VSHHVTDIVTKRVFFLGGVSPVSSKSKLSWPSRNLDKRFDHIFIAHYPTIESTRIKKKNFNVLEHFTHRNRALLMKTNNQFWESEIE
jgi:hypothetical protein